MPVATAPTSEIGYASSGAAYNWWLYDGETTPELLWPQSVEVYDAMRRTDAQVASVLRAVTLPVLRTPWRVDPAGARKEVVQLVADDLGLPIVGQSPKPPPRSKDRFSWVEHLRLALLMLPFGHMYFETVYRVEAGGDRAHLRKLAPRMPRTIEEINVARDGGLVSIKQYSTVTDAGPQRPIPVDRLVAYVLDKEGGNWLGRALAPDTPVPTPDGWRTIGDLRVGDRVFDETGATCAVTATRRWTDRPCYRLQFDDGEEIVADENHQWLSHVRVGSKREPRVVTTAEMALTVRKYGVPNHAIPLGAALDLPEVDDLPVDPYVLGAWLGDGHHASGMARICDSGGDVVAEIERRGYEVAKLAQRDTLKSWAIYGLARQLRNVGIVTGSGARTPYSCGKHVPATYLRASAQQRLDLLRGLMDTDGHFDSINGQCIFTNTNKALVDAVVELANGLGAKTKVQYVRQSGSVATMKSGALIHSRKDIYRVKFTAQFVAFNVERKSKLQDMVRAAKRPYHYVRSVEIEPNHDTVCVEVDSPSHLYLCGIGHKPTHNSILRPAYKNWLLKDRLLRVQAQTIERNGMGIPVYEAQEGASADDLAAGKAMAAAWRAGEAAGTSVPFGAKIRLVGVEGDLPDADPVVRYHDEQMARAVLAHFLNLGTQTGSWALGTTFADFFTLSLQTVAEYLRDVASQHVVEDLVDVNFGEEEPAPRLVFDEIGSRQAATAQAIKSLVDAQVIEPDPVLEESTRQQYGLPPKAPGGAKQEADDTALADAIDAYAAASSQPAEPVTARAWDPSQHPRNLAGEHLGKIPIGGRWRKLTGGLRGVLDIVTALDTWARGEGGDNPLDGFTVAQLRRAARAQGLAHHGGRQELTGRILDDVRLKVTGRRQARRDLVSYSYGVGAERPKAPDENGRLHDVQIRQTPRGVSVWLLDENDRPAAVAVNVPDWKGLRTWARSRKLKDLVGWLDKYHPSTKGGLNRQRKRLADLLATLRGYDTWEQAQTLLHGLEPAELAELYQWLGGDLGSLRHRDGRVSTKALIDAILFGWPQFRVVRGGDADPTAYPAAGSTPEVPDLSEGSVYGNPADWAEAGYDMGYLPDDVQAAAGVDVTPGREQLHHYWTRGKGLAKWADHPHPWTALFRHLVKYVGPERAERMASEWFHEVFGIWSGERKGRNPVGPG